MSRSRDKGTVAETAIVDYLRGNGHPYAERRALHGIDDLGDITGIPGVVIEAKACVKIELSEWAKEADREAQAADRRWPAHAPHLRVVWHKRKGKSSPADWFVTMTGDQFLQLLADR